MRTNLYIKTAFYPLKNTSAEIMSTAAEAISSIVNILSDAAEAINSIVIIFSNAARAISSSAETLRGGQKLIFIGN